MNNTTACVCEFIAALIETISLSILAFCTYGMWLILSVDVSAWGSISSVDPPGL